MANGNKEITLTYLNIRQSISILVAKLIFMDFITAIFVLVAYFGIVTGGSWINFDAANTILFLVTFIIIGLVKVFVGVWAILLWLNEYYEITPEYIYHKQGIFFRKTEKHRIDHVRTMEVKDTFLGEIFNFGTISLYEIRLQKYLDMNYVHNPRRYARVIKQLRPNIETKEDFIRILRREGENGERDGE